ncbi:10579_t:CDS:1 [Racocetra persica]|uniref:10579_t:CDS:1 n=1 Tax=Racocetra persica TaxID=160502 RepID=A0ACA9PQU2_9GLOM|nr:10579_t:CDS:1 [Racocetra persica]
MSQQRNKAKSTPILEKPPNTPSNSSEISQDLLNFGNQSPTSIYLPPNHQESIQLILRDIAKAFKDAATEEPKKMVMEINTGAARPIGSKFKPFHSTEDEDLVEWIEAFQRAANANNWPKPRRIDIASGYLFGIAANWYSDHKDDLQYWDNENQPGASFASEFVKYFTTPERRYRWQIDLNLLTQQENKKVDLYVYKFKRLQKRVYPKNKLPPTYVVRMFIGGLKGKIAAFMSIAEPKNLDNVIKNARKIKAGEYYEKRKEEDPTNQLIEALTHKMHQMAANYEKLTTTLAARVEVNPVPNKIDHPSPGRLQTAVLSAIIVKKEAILLGIVLLNDAKTLGDPL